MKHVTRSFLYNYQVRADLYWKKKVMPGVLLLMSQASDWDEESFKEAVTRAVDGVVARPATTTPWPSFSGGWPSILTYHFTQSYGSSKVSSKLKERHGIQFYSKMEDLDKEANRFLDPKNLDGDGWSLFWWLDLIKSRLNGSTKLIRLQWRMESSP